MIQKSRYLYSYGPGRYGNGTVFNGTFQKKILKIYLLYLFLSFFAIEVFPSLPAEGREGEIFKLHCSILNHVSDAMFEYIRMYHMLLCMIL